MKSSNIVFKNVEKIIKSEAFKYLFVALALLNVIAYVTTNSMLCLVSFIIAYGAADNWVSNNLGINLFVALFISNVIFSCASVKENFTNKINNEINNKKNNKKTNSGNSTDSTNSLANQLKNRVGAFSGFKN